MAILNVRCPDRPGLVAATAAHIAEHGGNIIDTDQHTDRHHSLFLQRIDFEPTAAQGIGPLRAGFGALAATYDMTWSLHDGERLTMALLVSGEGHCLYDILTRHALGELDVDIPVVISNHANHEGAARRFGVPFVHLPVDTTDKRRQHDQLGERLDEIAPDLVVLARYMQILPPEIIDRFPSRIINIHHSFLPAFAGAQPYHQAFDRGVKIIGASAHYATAELDQGPIISQQVTPVSHRDTVEDLIRRGRELEKVVLADAVRKHIEHRIQVYENRTVVFD